MTKQEVIELVKSGRLRGFLTPEAARYAINIEEMGTYTGIVLVNPDMKEAAYPVFNLDRAMERLQYIDTPEETAEILAGTINRFLQTAPKSSDININGLREKLSNYNAAKPYIFMDAVSHKYNNDRAVIHEINGMKFVPKIMISDEERMRAVSPVPKDWLIEQGISEDRLIDDAISNTANITHASIKSINEVITSIDDSLEIPYLPEMIVVTSESKAGGASVILDDNVRQQVSSLYEGKDFFVIPSSTHEVITVPVNNFFTPDSDTLKPNENVLGAIKQLIAKNDIDVYILSAYLSDSHYALDEKNAWLDKYLPELPQEKRLFVPCGTDKSIVVPGHIKHDDYLLDDYTKNLSEWEPPARGIKLINGINHTNGTWQVSDVPIAFEEINGSAHGYYSHATDSIAIQSGMSESQTLKTMIHEIAHSILHNDNVADAKEKDRQTKEVEAESVAYTVCKHFGIDSSDYSFGYIAGWSANKELNELKSSL